MVLFFVLLAAFRLSLTTKGHCFDADERRYIYALWFWKDILHGQFFNVFSCLFEVQGRPGFVLISAFPAALQILLAHLHLISTTSLHFFDLPSVFNVFITLVNSVVFYGILKILVQESYLAATGTVVYSLLVNSNVYIRHLVPYDWSLALFLIVILLMLKQVSTSSQRPGIAVLGGALSALGAMVYPGYYALVLIVFLFWAGASRFDLKKMGFYLGGFFGVIASVEILSEVLRKSYLMECLVVSDTVKHGSFAEGFLYIIRYLKDVEGLIGLVLFSLFLLYVIYFWTKDRGPLRWLVAAALLVYASHAILGMIFLKMVFYGRCLHLYFPFLVLAAIRLLSLIPGENYKKAVAIFLLAASVISFIPFARAYSQLTYPRDLYFKYLSQIPDNKILWILSDDIVNPSAYKDHSAVALNMHSYFDLKESYFNIRPPGNMVLVALGAHPLNFSSYAFENYGPEERRRLRTRKYQMKIYLDQRAPQNPEKHEVKGDSLSTFLYKVAKN